MKTTEKNTKSLSDLLNKSNYAKYSFASDFNEIIERYVFEYSGSTKNKLKSFFEDLQKGGCVSGMIGDFIYNSDCKEFYIKHIDCLEDMHQNLEIDLGDLIPNRHNAPHYTFLCWLCFEEYCVDLYRIIFEN